MRYSTPGRHTSSRRSDVSVRDIRSTYSIFRVDRGLLPESGTQLASSVLAACMANDLDVFVGCVLGASAGVPLSIRFNHGLTPLMVACKCGATQVVRWICQHDGAAVNSTDVHGNTALHLAAAAGYTLCVESLLSSGAAAARQNSEGVAPIHYAAYHGHKDTVLQVLRHSAAVTDQRDSSGKTPLMLAAFRGRTQAVSALLSSAASVNARDNAGWTALMYAAFTGRIVICRELLEYAANRTIVDYGSGKSAAVLAQDAGYYEVADMLLNKEALLRTPSLPEGIHMPAFSPVSRSATHSVKPAARMSQHTSFSSMLRPAIERALSPSLRRASRSINSQSRRAAYAAPLPLPLPPIPPAPVRHSRISATPRLTVPAETPAGLNIVLPSLHSVHRAASAATRVSNLAPIPEASNTEHTPIRAAHKAARARTTQTLTSTPAAISGGAAKPRRDPSLAPTHSVPEKQSTEIQLTPIAAKEALVKQTNKQPKRLTRKAVPKTAAHSLPGTTPAAAAAPKSNLTPIDGPPHTAIAMVPNKHRIQPPITPSGGWDQRATPAPLHGNAPKPPSIPDRIRDTISRASLKFHDVRTSQALKQENVATAATAFPAHLSHGNALSHTELGHATGAKYVNLGSVTHRRRKTASPTSRKAPPAADPYKRYHDSSWIRPYWNAFARIVTLWMPDFVLRILLRKETPGKRLAWREKIALCFIILLITAFTALISFGLSALFCHPVDPISLDALREKYGANGTQKLTVIRGRLYDVTDARHASSLGLTPLQFGSDASGMFAPFPDEAKKCAHWPPGKTSRNCYSVFGESPACGAMSRQKLDTLRQLETNKWIAYQWDDVLHGNGSGNLFVYNEFVYSLRPYLASTAAPGGDEYFGKDLTQTLRDLVGTDATIAVSRSRALQELVPCWDAQLRLGRIEGSTVGCVITSSITILVTVILNIMILIKLACAVLFDWAFSVQLTKITKHFIRGSNKRVPHVLITITCYDENEDTIRSTLDSIALTNYACSRKILFIIADGDVAATGDTRTTPQVLRGLINRSNPHEPVQPLPYIAVGEGPWAFNAAEVIPGSYVSLNGITVPCILIIKVGTKREREQNMPKAGNRGKRDSQLIILQWLRNVLLNDHLTPLEFELCRSASQLAKLNPDQFEYLLMVDADTSIDIECIPRLVAAMERDPGIMGLCGETRIANKRDSWVTRIQVYEYYISHHLSKAFESLWGGVTCLPGCCSMYRVFSRKTYSGSIVPLLVAPEVINAYSSNDTYTLHQKNLLLLGEDRYLTTVLLRAFPKRKLIYVPRAVCRTTVPNKFSVLVSQRRRWINSTIHNLLELILVRDLCGTFCCSMQFLVLMDLLGNVVLPSSVIFFYYLIIAQCIGSPVALPLLLMALTFVLQGLMILLTTQRVAYIYWMVIYILAIPVWNFIMPVYAFWRFDDFSWGKTRMVGPEDAKANFITEDERQALEPIPLMRWKDWMRDNLGLNDSHIWDTQQDQHRDHVVLTPMPGAMTSNYKSVYESVAAGKQPLPPPLPGSQPCNAPKQAETAASLAGKPGRALKRAKAAAKTQG